MQHTKAAYVRRVLIALAGLISLVACNQAAPPGFPPPPTVTVSKPEEKLVENWSEFTGRTAAVNFVNVTPRVSGYIVDIPFKEGDLVHQGDLLFQIDPRPYQDAYDHAVAQLQRAQASQKLHDITFERQERLQSTGVIAKEDYDDLSCLCAATLFENRSRKDADLGGVDECDVYCVTKLSRN